MNRELLFETKFWKIYLNEDQSYLGRCMILINRDCGKLSDLTSEEWSELFDIVKKLERALKQTFNATMFNWTCLMNNAYKAENPKPRVHLHFRPRYRNKVEFDGEVFEDVEFAHHYDRARKKIVSSHILKKISSEIKKHL